MDKFTVTPAWAVKMPGVVYIYGLYDPRGRLRYIGQAESPRGRLKNHWYDRAKAGRYCSSRKNRWLRTLDEPPEMRILLVAGPDEVFDIENTLIWRASALWPRLITNSAQNGNNPEWRAANASRSDKMKAHYVANPEARRNLSESALRNPLLGGAGARARWDDPAQREAARQRGDTTAGEYGAMMRAWWAKPENQRKMMRRNVSSATCWANNICSLDRPCKECGAPVGVFRVDPPCKTCQRTKRHTFWAKQFRAMDKLSPGISALDAVPWPGLYSPETSGRSPGRYLEM